MLKDKSLFKMYLRMNPEPKLPSNDYPEGRLKMRFLAMGNTTPDNQGGGLSSDAQYSGHEPMHGTASSREGNGVAVNLVHGPEPDLRDSVDTDVSKAFDKVERTIGKEMSTRRMGAPFCFSIAWPYSPVPIKASSFIASSMVRPSTYGQGYQDWRWPGAISGSIKVSSRIYFASGLGWANMTRRAIGTPVQGTAIAQASTQRCR